LLACAMIATAGLELFDLLGVIFPEDIVFWKKFSKTAEGCLVPLWLLFSFTFARELGARKISFMQQFISWVSCIFPIAALTLTNVSFFYSPDFTAEHILFLSKAGFFFYTAMLGFLVIALVNLETTLANSSHGWRWKIKLEIMGAVSLLAVLLFYYSQGFLYRTIDMNLVPLRSLAVIAGVALMAYSRLKRGEGVKIYVSKGMAFRSVVILAVGVYLLGVGLMGEGLKYFGESIHRSLAMGAEFLGGLALVVVLLSERVKLRIKVFLHRNFYRNKYDYRAQWLQYTDRLASSRSGDDLKKSIVSGFCEVFGMGCGALFLRDIDRQGYYSAATFEMALDETLYKPQDPLVAFIEKQRPVADLHSEAAEDALGQNEFVRRYVIRFFIPLILGDSLEGFVALGKTIYKDEIYTDEDYDLMKTLAKQATSAILNLRLSYELSRARELEAMGKLSAFVMHDLKNIVTAISLMVENAKRYINDPEFRIDMLESLDDAVSGMNTLIMKLKKLRDKGSSRREVSDLLEIAGNAVRQTGRDDASISGASVFSEVDPEEIHKVLLNLILNALDAYGGEGPVSVEVGCDDKAYIRVTDEGCGMSEDFLHKHLFKPFTTTKEKGLGIGLYQCKQIVESHGGRIEVKSEVGSGSTFTVWLPAVEGLGEEAKSFIEPQMHTDFHG
jgi:putative PEP-CTERM system histidine kinase